MNIIQKIVLHNKYRNILSTLRCERANESKHILLMYTENYNNVILSTLHYFLKGVNKT